MALEELTQTAVADLGPKETVLVLIKRAVGVMVGPKETVVVPKTLAVEAMVGPKEIVVVLITLAVEVMEKMMTMANKSGMIKVRHPFSKAWQ